MAERNWLNVSGIRILYRDGILAYWRVSGPKPPITSGTRLWHGSQLCLTDTFFEVNLLRPAVPSICTTRMKSDFVNCICKSSISSAASLLDRTATFEQNKETENAGIKHATKHLRSLGWQVRNISRKN